MVRVPYTVLLVSILIVGGWVLALSGENKGEGFPQGNRAASVVIQQRSGNSNHQWLADPEHGWLRVEEVRQGDKNTPLKVDYDSKRR